jgi:hypothetical protein
VEVFGVVQVQVGVVRRHILMPMRAVGREMGSTHDGSLFFSLILYWCPLQ